MYNIKTVGQTGTTKSFKIREINGWQIQKLWYNYKAVWKDNKSLKNKFEKSLKKTWQIKNKWYN